VAVTVTDLRTPRDGADATTNWTGSASPSLFTSAPDPVEASGHLGQVLNNTFGYLVHAPGGTVDLSSTLVYVWVLPGPAMATRANHGFGITLSDGTNIIQYNLGGSDLAAFRHNTGVPAYQCLVLDTANLPTSFRVHAGSEASLNLAAITGIGSGFTTTLKAVGGVSNVFTDIVRYGINGIRVSDGTTSDRGNFEEVAAEDALTTDGRALGICRRLAAGLYGLQGPVFFSAVGADSWFEEKNVTVVFEDRGLLTSRYGFTFSDDGSNETNFFLGTKVGTGTSATGEDGVNLVAPPGVGAFFLANNTPRTNVFIYGSIFNGFTGGLHLRTGQELIDCLVAGSGTVFANGATCVNTSILGSTVGANDSALQWNIATDPNSHLHGTSFSKGTNAHHAIEFGTNSPLTMTLTDVNFSGFSASNNVNDSAMHIRRTTGTVTINIIGGSGTPSYRTDGATVDIIQNPVTLTVTVRDVNTNAVIEGARVYVEAAAGGPETEGTVLINALTDVNGQASDTRTYGSNQPITGWVRKASSAPLYKQGNISGTISSAAGLDLTVLMVPDE
jgi:hypothetical protein